jgi:hypothetical protein
MNVAAHQDKIAKLEALRARLHAQDDFELWFWSAMTAGTHAVNAALHHAGVTRADDVFATQPGVYLVRQGNGALAPAFHPLGDVLHVGRPPIEAPVPEDVAAMMQAMETIEHHRDPCVRDGVRATAAIIEEVDTALRRCLEMLHERTAKGARA